MLLTLLKPAENISQNPTLLKLVDKFNSLLTEINARKLPDSTTIPVQEEVDGLNALDADNKKFKSKLRSAQYSILKIIEKNHKLVPQKQYTKLWMIMGMSIIGVPLGVMFGMAIRNMGLLGIGLPIGMGIGVGIGAAMDKKALKEGRQLGVEL